MRIKTVYIFAYNGKHYFIAVRELERPSDSENLYLNKTQQANVLSEWNIASGLRKSFKKTDAMMNSDKITW